MFFDGAKIQHFFDSTKFFTEKIQKLTLFNNYLKKICHKNTNITIIPITIIPNHTYYYCNRKA